MDAHARTSDLNEWPRTSGGPNEGASAKTPIPQKQQTHRAQVGGGTSLDAEESHSSLEGQSPQDDAKAVFSFVSRMQQPEVEGFCGPMITARGIGVETPSIPATVSKTSRGAMDDIADSYPRTGRGFPGSSERVGRVSCEAAGTPENPLDNRAPEALSPPTMEPTRFAIPRILRGAALRTMIFGTAALIAGACARKPSPPSASFLLVSLDTVRADHLGAWGYPEGTSPHLDRLARRGALFADCVSQATATLPSHRSMFRSRLASRSREETPFLAEVLRDAGYATCGFTGGGNIAGTLGFDRGFDPWAEDRGGLAWAIPEFTRWLDAAPRPRFFAFVHTYDAHIPYDPPRALAEYFDPGYAGTLTGSSTRPIARAIRGLDASPEGTPSLDDADRRRFVALYDGAIRRTDDLLGDLLAVLDSREMRDRTTVCVISDHGEEFWDHGSLLHSHTVHRELAHVPFILAGGEIGEGVVDPGVVRLLDVAPTIVDLAGLPPVPSHDGTSLADRARASSAAGTPSLSAVTEMGRDKALLEEPWKVILEAGGERRRLYDLSEDPGELRDLAGTTAAVDSIATALEARLRSLTSTDVVEELSRESMTPEQRERLKALGYVN